MVGGSGKRCVSVVLRRELFSGVGRCCLRSALRISAECPAAGRLGFHTGNCCASHQHTENNGYFTSVHVTLMRHASHRFCASRRERMPFSARLRQCEMSKTIGLLHEGVASAAGRADGLAYLCHGACDACNNCISGLEVVAPAQRLRRCLDAATAKSQPRTAACANDFIRSCDRREPYVRRQCASNPARCRKISCKIAPYAQSYQW